MRRELGAAAANVIARTVVPAHRDGGQSQYIESPVKAYRRAFGLGLAS